MTIDKLLEGKEFTRREAKEIINIAEYSEGQEKSRKNVEKALSHLDSDTGDRYLFSLMRVIRAELDELEEEAPRDENYDSWMYGEIRKAMLRLSIREDEIMSDKISYTPEEVVGALSEMYSEYIINEAFKTKMGLKDYKAKAPRDLDPITAMGGFKKRTRALKEWSADNTGTLVNMVKSIPEEEWGNVFIFDSIGTPYSFQSLEQLEVVVEGIQRKNRGMRLIYDPTRQPEESTENYLTAETN